MGKLARVLSSEQFARVHCCFKSLTIWRPEWSVSLRMGREVRRDVSLYTGAQAHDGLRRIA